MIDGAVANLTAMRSCARRQLDLRRISELYRLGSKRNPTTTPCACTSAFLRSRRVLPAIVVIQHQGGVDEFVQNMTQRLADGGYVAAAPDLVSSRRPRLQR